MMRDLFFTEVHNTSVKNQNIFSIAILFTSDDGDYEGHYILLDNLYRMNEQDSNVKYTYECFSDTKELFGINIPKHIIEKHSRNDSEYSSNIIIISINNRVNFAKFKLFLSKLKLSS